MSPQARLRARFSSGATYSARTCVLPIRIHLVGDQLRQPGHRPLTHLRPRDPHHDRIVRMHHGPDPHLGPVDAALAPDVAVAPHLAAGASSRGRSRPPRRRRRNCRRLSCISRAPLCRAVGGDGMDRRPDTVIRPAAADIAHRVVDVGIGRLRSSPPAAPTAVMICPDWQYPHCGTSMRQPRLLHRMTQPVARQPLDRDDLRIARSTRPAPSTTASPAHPHAPNTPRTARCRIRISSLSARPTPGSPRAAASPDRRRSHEADH